MNAITRHATLTALAAAAAAGMAVFAAPAAAQEATYELPQPVVSAKSRAEVRTEVLQARRDGTLQSTEADFQRHDAFMASRSRAEVAAEASAWTLSQPLIGEAFGTDLPMAAASQRPAGALTFAAR